MKWWQQLCVCDSLHSNLEVGPATFLTGLVFQILTFHEIQMPCQVHVLPGPGSRLERLATESKGLRPQMATSCSLGVSSRLPFSQCPRLFTCHIDGHWKHCIIGTAKHVQLKTYIALDTIHSGASLDYFYEHTTSSLALFTLLTCMPLTLVHSSTPSLHSTEEPSMLCRIAQGEPAPTAAVAASSGWSEVVPAGPSPP